MLKAVTGFTLPDNRRVEANATMGDDFADASIVDRLLAKGVLFYVDEEAPASGAVVDAEELPTPPPSPTTRKRPKARSGAVGDEEKQ